MMIEDDSDEGVSDEVLVRGCADSAMQGFSSDLTSSDEELGPMMFSSSEASDRSVDGEAADNEVDVAMVVLTLEDVSKKPDDAVVVVLSAGEMEDSELFVVVGELAEGED